MGTDEMATIYAAELRAIELALETITEILNDDQQRLANGAVIFTDNQAALRAIQNPKMPSSQIYLEGCLRLLEWCAGKIQVELHWIRAHEGIPGDEAADMLAKEATTTDINHIHNRYIRLAAAAKRGSRQSTKIAWETTWSKTGRTARRTKRLIEAPNKANLVYWKGLRKATSSVLIQLRTGIIGLAEYLSKIKRKDSPRRQCDMGNQGVRHVLLECPLLQEQRYEMMNELFEEEVSMTLGEEETLREVKAAPVVGKFMIATGLLGQFRSVDSVATGKEKGKGDEDSNPTKPNQETASAGEKGRTTQWPGIRSAEVTSRQQNTWRSANCRRRRRRSIASRPEPVYIRPAGMMQNAELAVLVMQGLGDSGKPMRRRSGRNEGAKGALQREGDILRLRGMRDGSSTDELTFFTISFVLCAMPAGLGLYNSGCRVSGDRVLYTGWLYTGDAPPFVVESRFWDAIPA
ncbi:hypothetical protein N7447_004662 [Penicillium robsamsonii]|uniref:uncharacterized protein n=1 Tax=Penicillium robsamsonii TaxID=1792511 RepID=UPI0025485AA2|nr:uncharacterized protein N7447_004662 [Penicillium robsamsonii]KAJ5827899.1 hypothetical protein N7447_004662 [Penicillium robsamsonii]